VRVNDTWSHHGALWHFPESPGPGNCRGGAELP